MSTYLSNNNIYATDVLGREGLAKFQSQMSHYYQENTEYRAFVEPVSHPLWYEIIARYIPAGGLVLEVGAGRSCFGDYLRQKELQVQYHSQDITKINYQWLSERSCRVWNCPLDEVEGSFDVIFSTYVYEHLVDPKGFLEQADRLLKPGGVHIIVGPNYDVPGYICPSLRHLGKLACLRIGLALFAMRMKQRICGGNYFFVNTSPAVFAVDWYRDADACHIVSRCDLLNWCKWHKYTVADLNYPGSGFRDWLLRRILLLQVVCRKSCE